MPDREALRDLTESYLKSLISEVSGSLSADFDSFAPFGELGLDSFYVLKVIRRLEADFGTLPKSLLFENFNINDLEAVSFTMAWKERAFLPKDPALAPFPLALDRPPDAPAMPARSGSYTPGSPADGPIR